VSGLVNDALAVAEAVALLAWSPAKTSSQASGREADRSPGGSPTTG
jgi:hypothetical protein